MQDAPDPGMHRLSRFDLGFVTGGGPRDCAVATWALDDAQRQLREAEQPAGRFLGSRRLGSALHELRRQGAARREQQLGLNAASACDPGTPRWRWSP